MKALVWKLPSLQRMPVLAVFLGLAVMALPAAAQSVSTLHSFTDGYPVGLVQGADGQLYGVLHSDVPPPVGVQSTVFRLNVDGSGYQTLYSFAGQATGLIQGRDGALYVTYLENTSNVVPSGVVFRINTDGSGYSVVTTWAIPGIPGLLYDGYSFGRLIQGSDGTLYCSASLGANNLHGFIIYGGWVFRLNTDGSNFQVLSTGIGDDPSLIQGRDGTLYGSTLGVIPPVDGGEMFRMNTDGSGFSTIYSGTNSGVSRTSPGHLIQGRDGVLYGIDGQKSTLFRLNTDGSGYGTVHSFTVAGDAGGAPVGLILGGDGAFYGTTGVGTSTTAATFFRVNADGSGFTTLATLDRASYPSGADGAFFQGSDGNLYGTSVGAYPVNSGAVFVLQLPPEITSPLTATAVLGLPYSYPILPAYSGETFGASGLPPGLTINTSTGIISGIPTSTGTYAISLSAASGAGTGLTATVTVVSTTLTLTVNQKVAPTFALNPASAVIANGRSAAFNAAASGIPAPTYQWSLDGTAIPGATDPVLLVSAAGPANAGTYTCAATNDSGSVTSTGAVLAVDTTGTPGYLVDISARGDVGVTSGNSGPGILFGGFGISGSGPKQVLIRGLGPGLAYQFPSILTPNMVVPAPVMDLFDSALTHLGSNSNWSASVTNAQMAAIGAYALQQGSVDAVMLPTLAQGSYNAWVSTAGTGTATGIGVVEIFDAETSSAASKIVNLSVRDFVGTGAHILIGGFVIGGTDSETLLIRGIGPGLADTFGVTGVVAQPVLQILDHTGTVIFTNTGWGADPVIASVARTVGAYALNPTHGDSALLLTLPPGTYFAFVTGLTGTTGEGVVEFYDVP